MDSMFVWSEAYEIKNVERKRKMNSEYSVFISDVQKMV